MDAGGSPGDWQTAPGGADATASPDFEDPGGFGDEGDRPEEELEEEEASDEPEPAPEEEAAAEEGSDEAAPPDADGRASPGSPEGDSPPESEAADSGREETGGGAELAGDRGQRIPPDFAGDAEAPEQIAPDFASDSMVGEDCRPGADARESADGAVSRAPGEAPPARIAAGQAAPDSAPNSAAADAGAPGQIAPEAGDRAGSPEEGEALAPQIAPDFASDSAAAQESRAGADAPEETAPGSGDGAAARASGEAPSSETAPVAPTSERPLRAGDEIGPDFADGEADAEAPGDPANERMPADAEAGEQIAPDFADGAAVSQALPADAGDQNRAANCTDRDDQPVEPRTGDQTAPDFADDREFSRPLELGTAEEIAPATVADAAAADQITPDFTDGPESSHPPESGGPAPAENSPDGEAGDQMASDFVDESETSHPRELTPKQTDQIASDFADEDAAEPPPASDTATAVCADLPRAETAEPVATDDIAPASDAPPGEKSADQIAPDFFDDQTAADLPVEEIAEQITHNFVDDAATDAPPNSPPGAMAESANQTAPSDVDSVRDILSDADPEAADPEFARPETTDPEFARPEATDPEAADPEATADTDQPESAAEAGMQVRDTAPRILHSSENTRVSLRSLPPLEESPDKEAENRHLYRNYVQRHKLPPLEARTQMLQHLQRLKVNALVAQKFNEAHKYQCLITDFHRDVHDQDVRERTTRRLDTLDLQLTETNGNVTALQKETARLIKDETEKQKDRRMLLLQRHATELRAFEDRWNDSEHLRKFAKPSSSLLEIKQIERSMVLTKMFDQAHSFKQKVRALEKVESGWAQDRAVSEMEKERDKLLRKQQLELENFDLHCARQTEVIRQAQELKKSAFNARQTKLASEIEDWTTHPATSLPLSSPPIFPKEVMTPRTAKRYSAFKRIAKPPVITVEPLGRVAPTKRKRPATASSI